MVEVAAAMEVLVVVLVTVCLTVKRDKNVESDDSSRTCAGLQLSVVLLGNVQKNRNLRRRFRGKSRSTTGPMVHRSHLPACKQCSSDHVPVFLLFRRLRTITTEVS